MYNEVKPNLKKSKMKFSLGWPKKKKTLIEDRDDFNF